MDRKRYKSLNRAIKRGHMAVAVNEFSGLIEFSRRTNTDKRCNFLSFIWPPVSK